MPRGRQDFVRARDRATRRPRRFREIGARDDGTVAESRPRRGGRRRGRQVTGAAVAEARGRWRQARSIVARRAMPSDKEIAEEWRRARSVRGATAVAAAG